MNEIEIEQKLNENLSASSGLKCHFLPRFKVYFMASIFDVLFLSYFFSMLFCKNNFVFQQTVH